MFLVAQVLDNESGEHIVCGNGAEDVIFRIVIALKHKRTLIVAPSFAEYEFSLRQFGIGVKGKEDINS